MNTTDYLPNNCGESLNLGGVWICKLATVPCQLYYGESHECEKEKLDNFQTALAAMINGDKE